MELRLLLLGVAYLLGSIPIGYLLVKRQAGADIRAQGSGGTGATNVLRTAGKKAALVTFLADFSKGALAVWLMQRVTSDEWWLSAAAIMAIIGHIYPVWLKFQGGKGVATGLGVFLVLSPLAVLSAVLLFMLIVWAKRYVSLGSIIGAASIPWWIWLYEKVLNERALEIIIALEAAALVSAALVIFSHRQNIRRLWTGTENKLGAARSEEMLSR